MATEMETAGAKTASQDKLARIVADPDAKRDYEDSLQRRIKAAREHLTKVQGDPRTYAQSARTDAQIRLDQVEAELFALQDAEWTKEITAERRAAWNAALQNPKYRSGKQIFASAIERDLHFSLEVLRRQVQRWEAAG
jgi:hypothetical protein